jgi:hypothetical protein
VPLGYLQELCGYWAGQYDWRAAEARLNQIPQFTTVTDGLANPRRAATPWTRRHS